MKNKLFNVEINPLCLPVFAFSLAFDLRVLVPFCAALLHEIGHFAAILLSGRGVSKLVLSPLGAEIHLKPSLSSYKTDLLVSLAGPFANILGSMCIFICEATAFSVLFSMCNIALLLFNLLPIRGLDGGEALHSFLLLRNTAEKSDKICLYFSWISIAFLWLFSLYSLFYYNQNLSLFFATAYLFFSAIWHNCD